jgi:probable HAF family extracellular repeat protein
MPSSGDRALGINDWGAVVGYGVDRSTYGYHALYWPNPSIVYDLGTLGGENGYAQAINSHGYIIGASETTDGQLQTMMAMLV